LDTFFSSKERESEAFEEEIKRKGYSPTFTLDPTLFCFASLHNSKGNSQELSYLGLIIIFLIISFMNLYKRKN